MPCWTPAYDHTVSSVLRPVGPERPGVYWLRRGVIIVIVVALVLLLVHHLAGGSPASPRSGANPSSHDSSPQPTVSAASTPRCTAADLTAALSTDKSQYASGEAATFTATIKNTSGTACRLHSTVASRNWTVTSGSVTTWSTAGCSHSGKPATGKLTATNHKTLTITWDAHRNDSSCTSGSTALPGTYVLRATFGGVKARPAVFHVAS